MIIGPASDEQKRMFDHMVALQDIAFEAIQPGVPCANVDKAVRAYYEKHNLMNFWKHHVGHAIGIRYHEVRSWILAMKPSSSQGWSLPLNLGFMRHPWVATVIQILCW